MQLTRTMNLLETGWRRVRRMLALVACVALVACGPGTGGTGTGPVNGVLTFSGSVGPSFSSPTVSQCSGDCGQAALRLEEAIVELQAPCLRFIHTGTWSVDASRLAILEGTAQASATTRSQPATLRLQFTDAPDASRQVTVVLLDAEGRALLAPQTLNRRDAAVTPGASSCAN